MLQKTASFPSSRALRAMARAKESISPVSALLIVTDLLNSTAGIFYIFEHFWLRLHFPNFARNIKTQVWARF